MDLSTDLMNRSPHHPGKAKAVLRPGHRPSHQTETRIIYEAVIRAIRDAATSRITLPEGYIGLIFEHEAHEQGLVEAHFMRALHLYVDRADVEELQRLVRVDADARHAQDPEDRDNPRRYAVAQELGQKAAILARDEAITQAFQNIEPEDLA